MPGRADGEALPSINEILGLRASFNQRKGEAVNERKSGSLLMMTTAAGSQRNNILAGVLVLLWVCTADSAVERMLVIFETEKAR